ncbi:hypothetical protein DAPPUDRAFT_314641 [Daphnia pulex]|uniref:Uncharacterized protein n=1 Tax=Daphnia pulex TaxID=6669 RepID=E9G6Z8_DAPPU|nr:hypothetical protein DAPPUDRAFT_314641 [Daphnia pulex]|eukprot:EFX84371.1 hypothetical protein DAPPUDRAFT_314641 [Daphnia pulex]
MLNEAIVADMEELQICRTTASQELTLSVLVHPKTIQFGHRGKQPSIHAELLLKIEDVEQELAFEVEASREKLINQNKFLAEISSKDLTVDSEKEGTTSSNYALGSLITWEKKSNCDVDEANLSDQSPEDLWRRDLEKLLVILNEVEVAEHENLALIAETTPSAKGRRINPFTDVKKAIASPIVSSDDRNQAPTYGQHQGTKKSQLFEEPKASENSSLDSLITWEKKSNCDVGVANVGCYQYLHQLPIRFQTNEGKQAYLAKKIKEIRECQLLSDPSPEDLWRRDLEELLVILNEAEVAEQENLALIAETTPSPICRRIDPSDVEKPIASPIVSSNDRNRAPTYGQPGTKKNQLSEEPKASGSGRASKEKCPAKSTKGAAGKPKSADDDMHAFKSPVKKPRLQ